MLMISQFEFHFHSTKDHLSNVLIIFNFLIYTFQVGASVWPAVAMVNFCLIRPKNRVPFISLCSLVWTCFLAYMKHLDKEKVAAKAGQSPVQLMKMNI